MPYDWNNPWGMDKLECTYLKCFCVDHDVKLAIEFGPGNSTQALLDAEVKVVSLESDNRRATELRQQYPSVEILEYTGTSFPIVAPWAPLERMFDLAIIDGPPWKHGQASPAQLSPVLLSQNQANDFPRQQSRRGDDWGHARFGHDRVG